MFSYPASCDHLVARPPTYEEAITSVNRRPFTIYYPNGVEEPKKKKKKMKMCIIL